MYHLSFDAATNTTTLHNGARNYRLDFVIEHLNVGGPVPEQVIVEQRLRDFQNGNPMRVHVAQFADINDLLRTRLLQCCMDWYSDNPWNLLVLQLAMQAHNPYCGNPACEPCVIRNGLVSRGANTKIDAWAKCRAGQREIDVGFESETSHHNSAMWSLMRLNTANGGVVESSRAQGTSTGVGVLANLHAGTVSSAPRLHVGLIAMWHDRLPGAQGNQPTYEWWVRTRCFRPATPLPISVVFVRLI